MSHNSKISLELRPSASRGHADHGWLKSFHSFSFASYHDQKFSNFGALRVINEDRVDPMEGFPTHPHREFEIWTYVISGELEHKDSMGNVETLKRGDVQHTSAGTGISHSEYNKHRGKGLHFLQIWAKPSLSGLKPAYYSSHHTDESKTNKLRPIILPREVAACATQGNHNEVGDGAIPIPADLGMWATVLTPGSKVSHTFANGMGEKSSAKSKRGVHIHLIQSSGYEPNQNRTTPGAQIKVNDDAVLQEGDGLFIRNGAVGDHFEIENTGTLDAELVLFDVDA